MSSTTFKFPALSNEGGLTAYLDQIKKFASKNQSKTRNQDTKI